MNDYNDILLAVFSTAVGDRCHMGPLLQWEGWVSAYGKVKASLSASQCPRCFCHPKYLYVCWLSTLLSLHLPLLSTSVLSTSSTLYLYFLLQYSALLVIN